MVRPESLTRQNQVLGAQNYRVDDEFMGYDYGLQHNSMVSLNGPNDHHLDNFYKGQGDSGVNTKSNIK